MCVAVESRFHASVLINNGGSDLSSAVQYDLTDQNLNGKERFCQCFSLVGLVSGQKQIFMDVSKAIHLIRKAYLSLTWRAYAQFMWELSKLVIWPQLFSAQSSDFTQQVELFAIPALTTEKTLRRQTKTLFTGQTVFLPLSQFGDRSENLARVCAGRGGWVGLCGGIRMPGGSHSLMGEGEGRGGRHTYILSAH